METCDSPQYTALSENPINLRNSVSDVECHKFNIVGYVS